ncbi:MAG: FGGY family carbohydrate kinase [Brooklawnia sp.]|uniref:gluconokinase n=1 Tax=Brooklawnia sp. TaxID=2699740 RepID=UPI003C744FC9
MVSRTSRLGLSKVTLPLLLALDIGSTASRGSLYDVTGRPIRPRAKTPHAFTTATDGTSTIDPDQVVDEVIGLISELVDLADGLPIAGVALDTFASSLVGVDASGRAITPCFNYNDNRCADEVAGLRAEADEDEIQARTGCRFHASYLPARLRWLARNYPDHWAAATSWLSLGEYIHLRLLGQTAAGTSTAAWSGLLNRRTGQWDDRALELSRLDAGRLSEVADPDHALRPQPGAIAHRKWPDLRQAHWFPAIGDGYAATRGIGTGLGGLVISLSTSGAMRLLIDDPVGDQGLPLPTGLWSYRVDAGHSLVGGAVNDVGRATAWMYRELNLPDAETLAAQLHEPPSRVSPLVLPFFTGERSTGWVGTARATVQGLDYSTSALELYRGVLEGIVWSFQRITNQLLELAPRLTSARVGGRVASEAPGLLTVLADGLTLELTPVTIKRSTLQGNAFIALDVLAPDVPRATVETGEALQPDPVAAPFYDARQQQLDQLYAAVVAGIGGLDPTAPVGR